MKRREFVRGLIEHGCHLKRHGANHDLYLNPANGRVAPVPRHNEITWSASILALATPSLARPIAPSESRLFLAVETILLASSFLAQRRGTLKFHW